MRWTDLRKRRFLGLGLVAVLVPLAILLIFQYRWLVELEKASAVARRAALDNYLEAVTSWTEVGYRKIGERVLNLPTWLFTEDRMGKAHHYVKKRVGRGVEGIRDVFVVSLVEGNAYTGEILFYDPGTGDLEERSWSPEVQAVYVAVTPWKTLAHKGGEVAGALQVDERDPRHRILINPITDESSRLVGVVGAVLDLDYVRRNQLPHLIDKALPKYFSEIEGDRELVVWVRDRDGRVVFATREGMTEPLTAETVERRWRAEETTGEVSEKAFPFVFTDWSVGIASRQTTAGEWARTNFELNVALSGILGLVLLGGVVLALMAASRAMKLSQMKSDFVSNVSHELRTPLASIRVFGELLRLGKVGDGERARDKVREYGEYIETESRRLTQLINNLLDFSSIESGRKSYRFEPTDLEELVTETLETFSVRLRRRGFRLVYEGPDQPLPPVVLDPGAMAQSLSNLVDNAVKYSDGNREILVSLQREERSVVLSVQDWGVGIPRDEQKKIFERFHRVSTGLVHDVKGSGLGLAIVQHIVQAHGGEITVESRSGHGSTFSLHLPLEAERERAGARGVLEEEPA
jgi:signal transduction histidine kinase